MKAFPTTQDIQYLPEAHGMDLRDYFAAKAMAALISEDEVDATAKEENFGTNEWAEFVAFCSYKFADAMMKYRNIKAKEMNNE